MSRKEFVIIFVTYFTLFSLQIGINNGVVLADPKVNTLNGFVRGKTLLTPSRESVYAFYGIPFAEPPVNELRFKKPVPIRSWTHVLDATKLPNSCSQIPFNEFGDDFEGEQKWNPNTPISEDCLYLNIWVPQNVFNNKNKQLAPVMFWIYGGGYFSGTSTIEVYNGTVLAGEEDVIVVSIQYRLGPLGFLYFDNKEAPGNMGLFDQNLALKWIHANIKAFGGDPDSITLFGESCGAVSVAYHLLSPLSQPFFKRAILMSGVATAPFAYKDPSDAYDVSVKLAKNVGCWSPEKTTTDIISCLRNIDHIKLSAIQFDSTTKFFDLPFMTTVDGHFLTHSPSELVSDVQTKKTNILIGNVKDEGSYFVIYKFTTYYKLFNHLSSNSIPYESFVAIMNEIFRDKSVVERDAIIHYYTNWDYLENGYANQQNIINAIGDAYFNCPGREFADQWAARGLNVYYYLFTERTSSCPWGEWMGVLHGDEIDYVFGLPLSQRNNYDSAEAKLSSKVMKLWANFAKTGIPSKSWSPYTKNTPLFVNLNSTTISETTPSNLFGPRASACAFWNIYLPKLKQLTLSSSGAHSVNNNKDILEGLHDGLVDIDVANDVMNNNYCVINTPPSKKQSQCMV